MGRCASAMGLVSCRSMMMARTTVAVIRRDGEMEITLALTWFIGCSGSTNVGIETASAGACDELVRTSFGVDEAVGRVVPPVFPAAQIQNRNRAPVIVR